MWWRIFQIGIVAGTVWLFALGSIEKNEPQMLVDGIGLGVLLAFSWTCSVMMIQDAYRWLIRRLGRRPDGRSNVPSRLSWMVPSSSASSSDHSNLR